MKNIREYAKSNDHEIIGKLTRRPEWEYKFDPCTGEKVHSGARHYSDEGGNEYIIDKRGCCIVTVDDEVI